MTIIHKTQESEDPNKFIDLMKKVKDELPNYLLDSKLTETETYLAYVVAGTAVTFKSNQEGTLIEIFGTSQRPVIDELRGYIVNH